MAGIAQINATYLPGEDRLLVRISTQSGEEFRLWLTRRLVAGLVGAFARVVDSWAEKLTPDDVPGRAALRDFQRDRLTSQGDFGQSYDQEGKTLPLGEAAILVVGANLGFANEGATLTLRLDDGRSLSLQLDVRLAGGLQRLLLDSAVKADWQLDQMPQTVTTDTPLASELVQ